MSKNNSFSSTTASRYSLALYELSNEENSLEEVESHSNLFLKLIHESEDFNSLIKDPTNSVEDLNNVLSKIAETYNLNKLLTKFLSFLISKRRFFFVQLILKDFVNTGSKKRGEVKAELISSKELSNDQIDKIKNDLSQNFNSKIKLEQESNNLKNYLVNNLEDRVLGPVNAPIYKVRGRYRNRLLIRSNKNRKIQRKLSQILNNYKLPKEIKLTVDVDPISFN